MIIGTSHVNPVVRTSLNNKRSIHKIVSLLFSHPFRAVQNILYSLKLRDYSTGNILYGNNTFLLKQISYMKRNNLPVKLFILPSYCEKPIECPDRFSIQCIDDVAQCPSHCKFKDLNSINNDRIFLTDDSSVADLLIEGFHFNRTTGGRYIFIMSICPFAHNYTRLFGIFGVTVIIYDFSKKSNYCNSYSAYLYGDAGLQGSVNYLSKDTEADYRKTIEQLKKLI